MTNWTSCLQSMKILKFQQLRSKIYKCDGHDMISGYCLHLSTTFLRCAKAQNLHYFSFVLSSQDLIVEAVTSRSRVTLWYMGKKSFHKHSFEMATRMGWRKYPSEHDQVSRGAEKVVSNKEAQSFEAKLNIFF